MSEPSSSFLSVAAESTTTSSVMDEDDEAGFDVYLYILPIIVLFGLSGNCISLVTIFHSRLRRVNANVYLIALTLADSVFLTGILLVCFKVDWIAFEYCVGLEYVLMTSSYISSWATAALTIERYLAIAHPLAHMKYGHVDRAKIMLYWVPIPFILQLFQFFSLEPSDGERKCMLKEANYQIIAQAIDTILCYVLPCSIIVILNIMVSIKVQKSQEHFMEEKDPKDLKKVSRNSRRTGGRGSSNGTWTRILWVMPLVFVVLNTPFYVIMMIEIIFQIIYQSPPSFDTRSKLFVTVYNTAHYMYYMNTAIDVLVYAFSSANFRKTAVIAWKRILCPGYIESQKAKGLTTDQTSRISYRNTTEKTSMTRAIPPVRTPSSTATPLLHTEVSMNQDGIGSTKI